MVLSNRLEADFEGDLFDAYRVLRTVNPSPYMFYFSGDAIEVAGASPETLVKLVNKKLYTFPLAGTRPRGKTKEEDLEKEDLSYDITADVMDEIMSGTATDAQKAAFLTALHMKGENIDEITACAAIMRKHCGNFEYNVPEVIDIVGTGGDCAGTFNISTLASVVAKIIGVNNCDLKTFTVDINNSARYRKMVPEDIIFISESGIKTAEDIQKLRENGTNAVLIGETFMRSPDKKKALRILRGEE